MLLRDGCRSHLSLKSIIEENELSARNTDNCIKTQQKLDYNSLENVRPCNFEIKDNMLAEDPDSGVYFKRYLNDLNVSIKT